MKPQDIAFLLVLVLLIFLRKPKFLLIAALACIILSAPLFYLHVFFTAQRLVMYGAGFILIAILFMMNEVRKER